MKLLLCSILVITIISAADKPGHFRSEFYLSRFNLENTADMNADLLEQGAAELPDSEILWGFIFGLGEYRGWQFSGDFGTNLLLNSYEKGSTFASKRLINTFMLDLGYMYRPLPRFSITPSAGLGFHNIYTLIKSNEIDSDVDWDDLFTGEKRVLSIVQTDIAVKAALRLDLNLYEKETENGRAVFPLSIEGGVQYLAFPMLKPFIQTDDAETVTITGMSSPYESAMYIRVSLGVNGITTK